MHTLYPDHAVLHLKGRFGWRWAIWIDALREYPRTHPDVIAYQVVLHRLARQQALDAGRDALCALTACRILDGYCGSEDDLLRLLADTSDEVRVSIMRLLGHQPIDTRRGAA